MGVTLCNIVLQTPRELLRYSVTMVQFSTQAVLVFAGHATDCEGAFVRGDRDPKGRCRVLCSFHAVAKPLPLGLESLSALVLSPTDARALARELERAAEDAEEQ